MVSLLVMEGDGIGPEISAATLDVLRAADRRFGLGLDVHARRRSASRRCTRKAPRFRRRRFEAAQGGRRRHPRAGRRTTTIRRWPRAGSIRRARLRKRLDLYANIRPARTRGGFPPRCGSPVDLVIVRENTEGFYADRSMHLGPGEFMPTPDLALAVRKITRAGLDAHRGSGLRARACGGARR